jgi:putative oxidoreductase
MTMDNFGISFLPEAWGFLAAIAEFGGGILFALGLFFRPVALIMAINMAVAVSFHLMNQGQSFMQAAHPIEMCIVFISAFFIGSGKLSLDNLFFKKCGLRYLT